MSKSPSRLGAAIEAYFADRFVRHRDSIQYLASFRTPNGSVFACQRVEQQHIILWLPEQEAVRRAAEDAGLQVERSVAWPNGSDKEYGRIHSLKPIPELREAPLLRVRVTTVGDAARVANALF